MNPKAKGYRRETQTRAKLEKDGFFVVRAGGSLGLWDIVALGPNGVRLVQVKSNRPPDSIEMRKLKAFPAWPYLTREVWVYRDYHRGAPRIIRVLEEGGEA